MSRSRVQEILAGRGQRPSYHTRQVFLPDVKASTFDSNGHSLMKPVYQCDLTFNVRKYETVNGATQAVGDHLHHHTAIATTKKTAEHYASLLALETLESFNPDSVQQPRPKIGVRLENEFETKWLTEAELCVYAQRLAMQRFGL